MLLKNTFKTLPDNYGGDFCEPSERHLVAKIFCKKAPSKFFDRVLIISRKMVKLYAYVSQYFAVNVIRTPKNIGKR